MAELTADPSAVRAAVVGILLAEVGQVPVAEVDACPRPQDCALHVSPVDPNAGGLADPDDYELVRVVVAHLGVQRLEPCETDVAVSAAADGRDVRAEEEYAWLVPRAGIGPEW